MTPVQALGLSAVVVLGVAVLRPGPAARPWLVNETGSLPRGLYRRAADPLGPGVVVALRPPPAARPYLASLGAPPTARLLKRVAAGPGEPVCRVGALLMWPRGVVVALVRDRRGRRLPAWRGCRRLGPRELLVTGDTTNSFDSRYFGPVAVAAVDGVYREVWRW